MSSSEQKRGQSSKAFENVTPLPLVYQPIRTTLGEHNHPRWGLLVYRCDYSSDDNWQKFLSVVRFKMKWSLECNNAEDLVGTWDLTVKENRESLDGASNAKIGDVFKQWVASNEAMEELCDAPFNGPFFYPRYTYCIRVDSNAIDSVVNRAPLPPALDYDDIGYVNLIRLNIDDFFNEDGGNEDGEEANQDQEPDYVSDDEEAGWEKNVIKACTRDAFGVETYELLYDDFKFDRLWRHRREDGVSEDG